MKDFVKLQKKFIQNKKEIKIIKEEIKNLISSHGKFKIYYNACVTLPTYKIKALDTKFNIETKMHGSFKDGEINLTLKDWQLILEKTKKELGVK